MKNWSMDVFNQVVTQELSFTVPLTADETEMLHFWHSEQRHINWPRLRPLPLSEGFQVPSVTETRTD